MDDRGRPPRFSIVFVSDDGLYDSETVKRAKDNKSALIFI
jgi:hypothetical protein